MTNIKKILHDEYIIPAQQQWIVGRTRGGDRHASKEKNNKAKDNNKENNQENNQEAKVSYLVS